MMLNDRKTKTTPPTLASYINLTHPAQAEDMQCVRELSSRFVFSRSAAFTLEGRKLFTLELRNRARMELANLLHGIGISLTLEMGNKCKMMNYKT